MNSQRSGDTGDFIKILIACVITLLAVSTIFMTQPIFLEISKYFNTDITRARFSFSVVSLCYAVSFFFIGPAIDRYNLPLIASIGLGLLGLAIAGASCTTDFTIFTVSLALVGFFAALVPASMFTYMATIAPKDKIGLYVGSIVASATLGVIFGRVFMGILTSILGWVAAFRVFAAIIFAFLLPTYFFLAGNKAEKSKAGPGKSLLESYKASVKMLLDFKVSSLLIAGFTLFFGFLGMVTFLTYRLIAPPFNYSAGEVGWISFAGLSAVIAPFSGNISQKVGIYKIVFPGLLICLLSLQFMGWFDSTLPTLVGLLLLFLGVYACQPLLFLLIGKNVSRESLGSASALYILFCIGGGSLSSMALGPVWQRFGWPGITVACSVFLLIPLFLLFFVAKRGDRLALEPAR